MSADDTGAEVAPEETPTAAPSRWAVGSAGAGAGQRPLADGDLVLLVDAKKRRYLVTLAAGSEFQTHAGVVPHDHLLGGSEGVEVTSTRGQRFTVYRPTLSDYILAMPRGAQVIYPKDIGPILMLADIEPGCRIFESGIGSGPCRWRCSGPGPTSWATSCARTSRPGPSRT